MSGSSFSLAVVTLEHNGPETALLNRQTIFVLVQLDFAFFAAAMSPSLKR
jgi:hypothetical protein